MAQLRKRRPEPGLRSIGLLRQQLHLLLIQEEMRELLPFKYRHLLRVCFNPNRQPRLLQPGNLSQLDGEGEESESNSEEIDNEDNIDPFSIYPTIDEVKPKVRRKVSHCAYCRIAPSSDDVSNSKVNVNCTQKGYIGICHGCRTYHCHETNSLDT